MRRRDEGPQFVGKGAGGSAPEPVPAEAPTPKSLRERWALLREDARTVLSGLPRAFSLVWSSHRGLTVALAAISVVSGAIPSATAWISKLLIDAVVAATNSAGLQHEVHLVLVLVGLQLALFLTGSLLQTGQTVVQQALIELTGNRVQLIIMEHANRLDLAFFENPKFYDMLQQAQGEASQRPISMVQQLFSLVRALITFLSMIALMARLGGFVAAMALIAPIPSFIATTRYGWRGYWLARRQSPERRRMGYFLDLLTRDTYNKEIKLFGLGSNFISRWKIVADRFYRENQALLTRRSVMAFLWGNLTTLVYPVEPFCTSHFKPLPARLASGDASCSIFQAHRRRAVQLSEHFRQPLVSV